MGVFDLLFSSTTNVSKNDSLLMFEERQWVEHNEYGGERTKRTERKRMSIHDYYVSLLDDPSRCLIISCSVNNRIIPMIDCDSEEDYNEAKKRLNDRNVKFAAFQSSPGKFWVFPDMSFASFDIAWEAVCYMPGCDDKYLRFVKRQGCYFVRGEPKGGEFLFLPELVENSCVEGNVVTFVNKLVDHFSDDRIMAIAKLKAKRLQAIADEKSKKKKKPVPPKPNVSSWY